MNETIAYMVTWTTYGTWLQGDKRGYVKDGKVLRGNYKLREINKINQKGSKVKLSKSSREIVKKAILQEALRIGHTIYAIEICSNHVHLVAEYDGSEIGDAVSRYKNAGYFALRKIGFKGRVWTKGFDKRYCFDEGELKARIDYVNGHK